jgi:hypothetical protein
MFGRATRMANPVAGTAEIVGIDFLADKVGTRSSRGGKLGPARQAMLDVVVTAPGLEPAARRVETLLPLSRWPSPGDTVPVTVDRSNPEHVSIDWAAVPSVVETARRTSAAQAAEIAARRRDGR